MPALQRCPPPQLIEPLPPRAESEARLLVGADRLGALASTLCAVHCASWPVVLGVLPSLGMSFLGSESLERGFVVFATALALTSLLAGWRRHAGLSALALLGPGLALIWFGSFGPYHHQLLPHAGLMTAGGVLVALSHWRNLQLARRSQQHHAHGPNCRH